MLYVWFKCYLKGVNKDVYYTYLNCIGAVRPNEFVHLNGNAILMKFSPLAAPEVTILTTPCAANDARNLIQNDIFVSTWQVPVQSVTKSPSKWRLFRFSLCSHLIDAGRMISINRIQTRRLEPSRVWYRVERPKFSHITCTCTDYIAIWSLG